MSNKKTVREEVSLGTNWSASYGDPLEWSEQQGVADGVGPDTILAEEPDIVGYFESSQWYAFVKSVSDMDRGDRPRIVLRFQEITSRELRMIAELVRHADKIGVDGCGGPFSDADRAELESWISADCGWEGIVVVLHQGAYEWNDWDVEVYARSGSYIDIVSHVR